jgi:hypothetical protein
VKAPTVVAEREVREAMGLLVVGKGLGRAQNRGGVKRLLLVGIN